MKLDLRLQKFALFAGIFLIAATSGWGQDTWINEDIQDWTASPYVEDSQETIDVGETTGIVDIIQSWVRPTTTEYGNTGFVQMRNNPMSFLELPEVPNVSQVEFNLSAFGADRSLQLQKYDGEEWVLVHTFSGIGDFLGNFSYDVDQDSPITLRLTSPSSPVRVHDIIIYQYPEPPTLSTDPPLDTSTTPPSIEICEGGDDHRLCGEFRGWGKLYSKANIPANCSISNHNRDRWNHKF